VLLLAPAKAKADSFNFSGTLASAVHGSTSITGTFTFTSVSGGSVPSFDFITPGGTLTNLNSTVNIVALAPAFFPAGDVVQLTFVDSTDGLRLALIFEAPISPFSASTFLTASVAPVSTATISVFDCGGCSKFATLFASGAGSPVSTTPVPEPKEALLIVLGLLALAPFVLPSVRVPSVMFARHHVQACE
jgi:hypothetical protein